MFGVSHYYLINQVREGVRLQEAVKKALETEPVLFQGKTYENFGDLCAAYRIQPANVYFRLEYGMDLKEALTRPIKGMGNKNERLTGERRMRVRSTFAGPTESPSCA